MCRIHTTICVFSAPIQTVPDEKENTRFARNPLPGWAAGGNL
ncbi:hypothetical protein B4099_1347 [Heyndrickxia coagulans]|uniref:Uncharacterized protein n=1 Tax=Heyndrickxia coagulans TaxID=1398 RepID=A0A150KFP4_HEYCO|nr:hypothetical protein B4099_1347 [Heyndrickxia coagulans]